MRKLTALSVWVLGLAALVPAAVASTLYGVDAPGATNDFLTLDQATGADLSIGATGYDFPGDLTSDTRPASYRIWAPDITTSTLIEVDPTTGAGTPIGAFDSPSTIVSVAFDIATGKLYGTTAQAYGATNGDALYEIDPATAACTYIGALGIDNVFALAFDNNGTLYGVGNDRHALFEISTLDGTVDLIAPIAQQFVFDIATRPEDGVTFLVDSGTSTLYTLDLTTGATAPIGAYDATNIVGLVFSPVPEPASLLMAALLALFVGRRR